MQASIRLNEALQIDNAQLKPRGLEVRFLEHVSRDPLVEGIDSSRNLFLAIRELSKKFEEGDFELQRDGLSVAKK